MKIALLIDDDNISSHHLPAIMSEMPKSKPVSKWMLGEKGTSAAQKNGIGPCLE
jgi:hypothetical protein